MQNWATTNRQVYVQHGNAITHIQSIAELLKQARVQLEPVSDTAQLDAEILLSYCLGKNRAYLYTWPEKIPEPSVADHFLNLTTRRTQDVPVAYLTGEREFWSLTFKVTPDTLIPRPETELIVQLALDLLHQQPGPVLDLGTGSGAIAVSIATEFRHARIDAIDNCSAALDVARQNAEHHKASVNFIESDWFTHVTHSDYQLIISNPPYIAENDPHLSKNGLQHEPISALQAPDSGMAAIKCVAGQAARHAVSGGWLLVEHGHEQGPLTRDAFQQAGISNVRTEKDLEARDRVTLGQLP